MVTVTFRQKYVREVRVRTRDQNTMAVITPEGTEVAESARTCVQIEERGLTQGRTRKTVGLVQIPR